MRDLVYSLKAAIASTLALAIGFDLHLENPYWSALTVYIIVSPPGAGAIRSKAIFRLLGTLTGGALVITAVGLFGDHIGILLVVISAMIVGAMFFNQADKTPANYFFFAIAVTGAVIALSNVSQPSRIFSLTTARVAEICIGILSTVLVDCLWPELMTPAFLQEMVEWRKQASDFARQSLAPRDGSDSVGDRQGALQTLIKGIEVIDSKAIPLPFDLVPRAPRKRDLDLTRRQVAAVVADLIAIELRVRHLDGADVATAPSDELFESVAAWLGEEPDNADRPFDAHIGEGRELAGKFADAREALRADGDGTALVMGGLLDRVAMLLNDWCDLLLALRTVETGQALPRRLARAARRARPVRSIDHVGIAFDLLPLVLALTISAVIWYSTAWDNGTSALLFSFAGCVFLVGQGQILQSTLGFLACILVAFGLVFVYQFVILPRVTDYVVLALVLSCALFPLGVLMAMSAAGSVIAPLIFSFLGLQDAYTADFAKSFQTLVSSVVGLLIAVVCLRICAYDRARFKARRMVAAVRRDVLDVARAAWTPDLSRFGFLALYRLSIYFAAAGQLKTGGPIAGRELVGDLSVGYNLLRLRQQEPSVSPGARGTLGELRQRAASTYRGKLDGRADGGALRTQVEAAIESAAVQGDPAREDLLESLIGLHLALDDRSGRAAASR